VLTRTSLTGAWLIGTVLIAAVSGAGLLGQGVTQPRDPVASRETAVSTGALTGRIVRAGDGTPLARVEVRAEPTSGSEPRIALTDFNGRFQMTDMPAGLWMLTMSKSGYLRMKSGQRTPSQPSKAVRISPGETTSFDGGMIPGAAITGYVVDELGDPVAGVAVEALRPRIVDGQRRLTAVARDLTDDTGAYRLHSLARGEYVVSARLRVGSPDESSGPTTALPTFFPGTTSLTEAGRISLRAGEERSGMGFPVSAARAVRVSGTVIDSTGRGVDEAAVELFDPADGTVIGRPFGNFGLTQGGGRFGILNIAPGRYALSARIDRDDRRGAEVAIIPVTVGAFDVEVAITTRPVAVLSGTIVAGPGATLPRQLQASIWALPTGDSGRRTGATVAPDRSFELSGFSGPTRIWVGDLPRDWAVSRIEINGTNVTDETFELRPGVEANMRVVVTNQLGTVRGSVTARNLPAADVAVLVFTTDAQQWSVPTRYVKWSRTDARGQFSVDGLPPGDYRAVALDDFTDDEPLDADLLGRVRDVATPITVGLAAPASVNLTMTER
jgi:protocatechuate 3,4-dioxygenase beta subunit